MMAYQGPIDRNTLPRKVTSPYFRAITGDTETTAEDTEEIKSANEPTEPCLSSVTRETRSRLGLRSRYPHRLGIFSAVRCVVIPPDPKHRAARSPWIWGKTPADPEIIVLVLV